MRHLSKLVGLAVLGPISCGKPATEQECNEILTRTATLEYQTASKAPGPIDPAQIETIRARLKDSMMRNCVGKRITEKAMNCVRTAKSAKAIEEQCFD